MTGGIVALAAVLALSGHSTDDARRVAARIDEFIFKAIGKARVAPLASDAAFLRRLSLDVTGKIPSVSEVRKFLADSSPEKRVALVERQLDSIGYTNHFTQVWLDLLLPEARADLQNRYLLVSMERWLRTKFTVNASYDTMVRELVALPLGNRTAMDIYRSAFQGGDQGATPVSYYLAKRGKPDDLAAGISRLFLGVRLECAQCHDHPFGKWKREEFWSQAAFFAGVKGPRTMFDGNLSEVQDRRELIIPKTDRVAQARFLDGKTPRWKFKTGARTTYAAWMTARDNPFFARAMANRMWAHFFGIGLVDPVDDLVESNPASHPELLDYLARQFVEHGYDLKFLIKTITLSRTYQLSSKMPAGEKSPEPRLFARMAVRGLTGDQLYDSLLQATGQRETTSFRQRAFAFNSARQTFLEQFTPQEHPTEHHTAIPQALLMMNSPMMASATHPDRGLTLGAILEAPFLDTKGRVEALFLAALSRKPTSVELSRFVGHVEKAAGRSKAAGRRAMGDVFWSLLNSTEFMFNH